MHCLPLSPEQSGRCTNLWVSICGRVPESASTEARRRCGTQSTTDQSSVTRWSRSLKGRTPMPLDSLFDKQGIKVLGTPLGHPQFVEAHLNKKIAVREVLLERIPAVPDLQSSWSLLLHCASARANFLLRVVKPEARGHTHSNTTRACGSVCAGCCTWTQNTAQTAALQAVQRRLVEGERLFAFLSLDDVYVTTPSPDRVGPICRVLDAELHRDARIRINGGKTQEASAQNSAMSWRGWHNKWIQMPGFGGDQIGRQRSKASPCWAHLLAGRSLFTHS